MTRTFMWKDIECIVMDHGLFKGRKIYRAYVYGLWKIGIKRSISGYVTWTIKSTMEEARKVLEAKGYDKVKQVIWEHLLGVL